MASAESWLHRNHFLLRRLHSLSGIVPIGFFLVEHLFTNSLAWLGPSVFNEHVRGLHALPYLVALEFVAIFLPLAFHAAYGVVIARGAKFNATQYTWLDNWRYTLQRVTGWVALVYILIHLGHYRFNYLFGGPEYVGAADPFALTQAGMSMWPGAWFWWILYVTGLLASVYHFANGLVTFCITWGITVGDRSRRRMSIGAAGVGLVLLAWGILSLAGLQRRAASERFDNVARASQLP